MGVAERKKLILSLEKELGARILSVVTGDRQGLETRIAPDILPLVSDHLSRIGSTETLALFLYTPGGDTIAGWGLVNLVRQYCHELKVLVPFRALSCGTLVALGANEILMGRHGFLSPIDPSVSSPFNPPAPGGDQPGRVSLLPVSVEDMLGFLELASKETGLKSDESMAMVLNTLATKVHPLALGAVYRAREQSSSMAKRLIMSHSEDEGRADRIVSKLTRDLPTHSYLIGREEALSEIDLDIIEPTAKCEQLMWDLYKEYQYWLKLTSPVSPELDIGTEQHKTVRYERAVLESLNDGALNQHVFISDKALVKIKAVAPGTQIQVDQTAERLIFQGWVEAKDGEVLQ